MKAGDLIFDKIQKKVGIALSVYVQPPSPSSALEVIMAEYIHEDGTIAYVEVRDAEVLNEA